jgi:hypothetical protein
MDIPYMASKSLLSSQTGPGCREAGNPTFNQEGMQRPIFARTQTIKAPSLVESPSRVLLISTPG